MTTRSLRLAKDMTLPLDAVTQTIAILAKRRAGKSYTMRRLTEQLLKAGQQVVIVDPKGDQWGLRSAADGKAPGLPIVILGGERGDVPLESTSGEIVAKLVVEDRVSVLLDLSLFRKHEVATFMTAFLENLYRMKAKEIYRTPVMLVIDEADAVAPQKPQKGEERMLGAAEDIVRRGGQRGIGCVLVTQRSAVLNKNVLTQAQVLVVLRTIAPQDLAAMKAWVDVHGDAEQGRILMESLPSLPVGDAWFWSPGWPTTDGIFKRVHVLPIETFDSGKSPDPGVKPVEPKNLADVDLDAIKGQMKATIEKAKQDDPRELKKEIARLTGELSKAAHNMREKGQPVTKTVEKAVLTAADRELLQRLADAITQRTTQAKDQIAVAESRADKMVQSAVAAYLNTTRTVGLDVAQELEKVLNRLDVGKILDKLANVTAPAAVASITSRTPATIPGYTRIPEERRPVKAAQPAGTPGGSRQGGARPASEGLDEAQQKIIDVIAMLEQRGIDVNKESIARWVPPSGIHPRGGSYGQNLGFLRANGYLEGFTLTDQARAIARPMETGLAAAKAPLEAPQAAILDVLDTNQGKRFSKDELAQALGIHPRGGSYGQNLGRLRAMGLIPERGDIYLTEGAQR